MVLSKNLSLNEFIYSTTAKRLGIDNTPPPQHLESAKILAQNIFQPISDHFGVSIFLSSGYRSEALNKAIKGAKTSQHCRGEAMDIDMDGHPNGVKNIDIFNFIKEHLNFDQLIWEFGNTQSPDWVHVSYSPSGHQRKEILKGEKTSTGKTTYTTWK